MTCWHQWHTDNLDGATNMAYDQATLELSAPSQVVFRTYTWKPACLSLGVFQSSAELNRDEAEKLGVDIVRRPTGGRAVLHDVELTYCITVKKPHPLLDLSILESYYAICSAITNCLINVGVDAKLKKNDGPGMSTASCFAAPTFSDIEADGKKLVGSAQMRTDDGMLQHGSILIKVDREKIFRLITPDIERAKKLAALSQSKITSIEEQTGHALDKQIIRQKLLIMIENSFNVLFKPYEPVGEFEYTVDRIRSEKYSSDLWTYKR